MTWWAAALWGGFGGVFVVAVELIRSVRATRRLPWRERTPTTPSAYVAALLARVVTGGGLAWAAEGTVTTPLQALAVGVAAPLVLEKLAAIAETMLGAPERRSIAYHTTPGEREFVVTSVPGLNARCAECHERLEFSYPCLTCGYDPLPEPGGLPEAAPTSAPGRPRRYRYYLAPEDRVPARKEAYEVVNRIWYCDFVSSLAGHAHVPSS